MKTEETMVYEAPQVEVLEVEVEKGFAASGGNPRSYTLGGSLTGDDDF